MPEVLTTIDIDAPAERVWEVLADLPAYDEWNPFMTRVRGRLAAGARFDFMAPFGNRDVPIDATMLTVEQPHEIRWRGPRSALVGKAFRGEHYLRLEPLPSGGTRLTHGETFSGLIPALLWSKLEPRLLPLYSAMNEALKQRAEGQ